MSRPSWAARVAAFVVRHRIKPALGDLSDIARVRRTFGHPMPPPRGARYTPDTVGGVPGEWVEPAAGDTVFTLLYLHGGGFVGCSPRTHRPITAALARRGARVFVPDYRLAPEHRFPAAVEDACAAWRALAAQAPAGRRLVVAGDSAGGNLALSLMQVMRDEGARLPDAAALFSPATDLTGGSPSLHTNAERDAMFQGEGLQHLARAYLGEADAAHPLASPLLGDLRGLPPLLVHVGEDEALRDDSLRLAEQATAAGVNVALTVWPGVPHVWQLLSRLPEARRSIRAAFEFLREARADQETLDVAIIGAGLSGIGAAAHLQDRCPDERFAVLEARGAMGGTWDLFRYPGIRSDSDMYTLGYAFRPWTGTQSLADGPSIKAYIEQTAAERGIDRQVRFHHKVLRADWSSADARWHLTVHDGRRERRLSCRLLWACAGYYSYAQGHRPRFPDEERFAGRLVHPQFWPEDLDWRGRRVVVIGSGATAVTLVPQLAREAARVTMLQRSPTYVLSLPGQDRLAALLQRVLPAALAYRLVRAKNILVSIAFFRASRRWPKRIKALLVRQAARQLGRPADAFTPRYDPWDQRVCFVPDGDLFHAVREGRADVVTDEIERFVPEGVVLRSGRTLPADVVVTATGLKLNLMGDVAVSMDGVPVDFHRRMAYKGSMFGGVPNLVTTFGYTNASWTLKADLTAGFACRLLNHLRRTGATVAVPQADPQVAPRPFLELNSGYVQRAEGLLPHQGDRRPWRLYQNYLRDFMLLRWSRLEDGTLRFGRDAGAG